jgi:enediyne biosynthesis protein E4
MNMDSRLNRLVSAPTQASAGIPAMKRVVQSVVVLFSVVLAQGGYANETTAPFVDVSGQVGLRETKVGNYGPFWIDFNGDDWTDLVFMNHGFRPTIYENHQGIFRILSFNEAVLAEERSYPEANDRHGGSCGDYDNDGRPDIFIAHGAMKEGTLGGKYDELLHNEGEGRFREVTSVAGIRNSKGRARTGSWVDVDKDGWLDLYIGNFDGPNVFYRNNGDGTFFDHTMELGLEAVGPRAAWADFDADGNIDVLVAWPVRLLRNNGSRFIDVTNTFRLNSVRIGSPFTAGWGDIDDNGRPDVLIGSLKAPTYAGRARASSLFKNDGGQFVPVRQRLGPEVGEMGGGWSLGDFDNDGFLDLITVTSKRLRLFRNLGGGKFLESQLALDEGSRDEDGGGNPAIGDFDNDGLLDVAVDMPKRHLLLRNMGSSGQSWIKIVFEGRKSNKMAIGAKVFAKRRLMGNAVGKTLFREYSNGDGVFKSIGCGPMHIGLGSADRVDLRIIWPSGVEQELENVPVNRLVRIVEPTAP